MLLVLDANVYLFALGPRRKSSCAALLNKLLETSPDHNIRIPRLIVEEVKRNLSPRAFREFLKLISTVIPIDENIFTPLELGIKYELRGLKLADAFIAAYTEWAHADILVSENRHFLSSQRDIPFKILTAEACLKILGR